MDSKYNGWKNYQTWNVSAWIGNDEPLYRSACDFMRNYKGRSPYASFCRANGLAGTRTPDRVAFTGSRLGYAELNTMMRELA
jgi:hypothetical protein